MDSSCNITVQVVAGWVATLKNKRQPRFLEQTSAQQQQNKQQQLAGGGHDAVTHVPTPRSPQPQQASALAEQVEVSHNYDSPETKRRKFMPPYTHPPPLPAPGTPPRARTHAQVVERPSSPPIANRYEQEPVSF